MTRLAPDDLTAVLITYNRPRELERTLGQIAGTWLAECEFFILNNPSPDPSDNTAEVVEQFRHAFPRLTFVRHRYNIGGNTNFLRALEVGSGHYKWVLCDDDEMHLNSCEDVLQTIAEKKAELIRVGNAFCPDEAGRFSTFGEWLLHPRWRVYEAIGFYPSLIFRQDRVGAFLDPAYRFIHTGHAHLYIYARAFALNAPVYAARQPLVTVGEGDWDRAHSEVYRMVAETFCALPSGPIRDNASRSLLNGDKFLHYLRLMLADRIHGRPIRELWSNWVAVFYSLSTIDSKFQALCNLPAVFCPAWLLRIVRRIRKGKDAPPLSPWEEIVRGR